MEKLKVEFKRNNVNFRITKRDEKDFNKQNISDIFAKVNEIFSFF